MFRPIFALALLLPLAACGMPTPVSLATLVLDIGSYAVTGKTTTDHAVSAVAGEDCAVIRVIEGDACSSPQDYEMALGVLEPLPEEGAPAAAVTPVELLQGQTAAVGVEDLRPASPFAQVAFLSDDLAPGTAVAGRTPATGPVTAHAGAAPAVQLGAAGFLSDDARPDTARATTQLGRLAQPKPLSTTPVEG